MGSSSLCTWQASSRNISTHSWRVQVYPPSHAIRGRYRRAAKVECSSIQFKQYFSAAAESADSVSASKRDDSRSIKYVQAGRRRFSLASGSRDAQHSQSAVRRSIGSTSRRSAVNSSLASSDHKYAMSLRGRSPFSRSRSGAGVWSTPLRGPRPQSGRLSRPFRPTEERLVRSVIEAGSSSGEPVPLPDRRSGSSPVSCGPSV